MSDGQFEIQQAIYTRLSVGLINIPVHDHVPEDAPYPYVVMGDFTAVDESTKGELGINTTVALHIWSRAEGNKEARQIMGKIYDLLHRHNLVVSGFTTESCELESSSGPGLDADMKTRHGIVRYRIVAHDNS